MPKRYKMGIDKTVSIVVVRIFTLWYCRLVDTLASPVLLLLVPYSLIIIIVSYLHSLALLYVGAFVRLVVSSGYSAFA
ncbi:814_t:CDS:2, partial [Dentiscutata erythropus]